MGIHDKVDCRLVCRQIFHPDQEIRIAVEISVSNTRDEKPEIQSGLNIEPGQNDIMVLNSV